MITIIKNLLISSIALSGDISSENEEALRKIENDKMLQWILPPGHENLSELARVMVKFIYNETNKDNFRTDFAVYYDELQIKNQSISKKGYWENEWKIGGVMYGGSGDDIRPLTLIAENVRIGCYIKNSGREEREYRYSWYNVYRGKPCCPIPQEIEKKAFLVFPWTTATIKSDHHHLGDGNSSIDLYIKTKSGEEIKATINLKTKDEDGREWILTWAPLEHPKK